MIVRMIGDLLELDADIICHQTNYQGVMGAGIAYSIRERLLSEEQIREYERYCFEKQEKALGTVQYLEYKPGKFVANCFSQGMVSKMNAGVTNYAALKKCLMGVQKYAARNGYSVALPCKMGCGLAGGNWELVQDIIERIFVDIDCLIVYQPHDAELRRTDIERRYR